MWGGGGHGHWTEGERENYRLLSLSSERGTMPETVTSHLDISLLLDFRERKEGRERERNVGVSFHLFMHSSGAFVCALTGD